MKKKEAKDIIKEQDSKLEELLKANMVENEDDFVEGDFKESVEDVKDIPQNGKHPIKEEIAEESPEEETYEDNSEDREIPAKGFMYAVKDEYLPETTRLNAREISAFAFGHVKNEVLKPNRTNTVYEIYSSRYMKHKIGEDGKGRDEWFIYKNVQAQEKAEADYTPRGL